MTTLPPVTPSVAPKVTIVTPSYNQAPYLSWNLRSVAGQRGVAVEHLLLDGGSTDHTREVIAADGGHLAWWRSEKDAGQTAALIEGFERASGDILGWINSDDFLWGDEALSHVARAFAENPEAVMVTGDTVLTDEDGQPVLMDMVWRPSARQMRYNMAVPQQSTFFRASAYRQAGGINPEFSYCMDFDLFQRLSRLGSIVRIPLTLAAFRLQRASKTATLGEVFRREMVACQGRYGSGALHWLAVKAVTMEIRLGAVIAEAQALLTGRPLPCLANARLEPCRAWARKRRNVTF